MKLTRRRALLLRLAIGLGGTIRVFPDQRLDIDKLERDGLMLGNGKHFDRTSTITDAGRRALAELEGAGHE